MCSGSELAEQPIRERAHNHVDAAIPRRGYSKQRSSQPARNLAGGSPQSARDRPPNVLSAPELVHAWRRARHRSRAAAREGGKAAHDPGSVRLRASSHAGRGAADPAGPRGGGQDPVGRVQPDPAHQAAARPARAARRHPGPDRPRRHHRGRGRPAHRLARDPPPDPRERAGGRPLPAHPRRVGRHRRPAGPQLGHDRRLGRSRGSRVGLAGGPARRERHGRLPRRQRRPRDRGPRLLPRHVHDGDRAHRGPRRGPVRDPAQAVRRGVHEARAAGRRLRHGRRRRDRPARRRWFDHPGRDRRDRVSRPRRSRPPTPRRRSPASSRTTTRSAPRVRPPRPRATRSPTSGVPPTTSARWSRS